MTTNMSNMKTPLKKARGLGSAKSGTEHFWQQRLTAIFNLPLILFFVWFIVRHLGASRADVMASLHNPLIAILLLATLASVFWHMRLGMQVIIEDYVHGHGAKLAAVILNTVFVAAMFSIAAFSILKMSFA
jgi:succinate dehydrogenase / fumarate reductase, membrane anchor subunit